MDQSQVGACWTSNSHFISPFTVKISSTLLGRLFMWCLGCDCGVLHVFSQKGFVKARTDDWWEGLGCSEGPLSSSTPTLANHVFMELALHTGHIHAGIYTHTCWNAHTHTYKENRLEAFKSWWETPLNVVENDRAYILSDFRFQTDKQLLANQADIGTENSSSDRGGNTSW